MKGNILWTNILKIYAIKNNLWKKQFLLGKNGRLAYRNIIFVI